MGINEQQDLFGDCWYGRSRNYPLVRLLGVDGRALLLPLLELAAVKSIYVPGTYTSVGVAALP